VAGDVHPFFPGITSGGPVYGDQDFIDVIEVIGIIDNIDIIGGGRKGPAAPKFLYPTVDNAVPPGGAEFGGPGKDL
jgi:hypothetical protein